MRRNGIEINPEEFQKSITEELNTIKDRVRNLIGSSHWGEEGRYKEAILRNVIRRFLPQNLSVGTGFVIRKDDNKTQISHQIDIIVYDNTTPVLFSEGDFVITTYKNVKAIIEVKTKIENNELDDTLKKAEENGSIIERNVFNGVFSYEYYDNIKSKSLDNALKMRKGNVNHLSLGKNIFIKFWKKEDGNKLKFPIIDCKNDFYNIYRIKGLSFSYFISNLIDMASSINLFDIEWFLYPIRETKENYRKRIIFLEQTNDASNT